MSDCEVNPVLVGENETTNIDADLETTNDDSASICAELEKRLSIGNTADDLDQTYILYCEYARLTGFSVRKGDNKYFFGSKVIRCKELICSCEGVHDAKSSTGIIAAFKKQNTRSNCKVRIRLVRTDPYSVFKVQIFDTVHNHELAPIHQSYLLRCARNLTHGQKLLVEALKSAGIGVSRACRFLERESGRPQNIGFQDNEEKDSITNIVQQGETGQEKKEKLF